MPKAGRLLGNNKLCFDLYFSRMAAAEVGVSRSRSHKRCIDYQGFAGSKPLGLEFGRFRVLNLGVAMADSRCLGGVRHRLDPRLA
jgi:hypothetical protein